MKPESIGVIRWAFDVILVLCFFRPIQTAYGKESALRLAAAFLSLAAIVPLYVVQAIPRWDMIRLLYRAGWYTVYLRVAKIADWRWSVYYALEGWFVLNICSNILLSPILYDIYYVSSLSDISLLTLGLGLCVLAFVILLSWVIPFDPTDEPGASRFALVLALCFAQIYIKSTSETIRQYKALFSGEINVYLILLQILLGVVLIFVERYLHTRKIQEKERLAYISNNYRYESAKAQRQAEESLKRMYHDINNHLIVMQQLSRDNSRLDSYIGKLMSELGTYDCRADTGNELMDALLSFKMRTAFERDVELLVELDLRSFARIEDMDLCTILGNILDNAIEAASQMPNPEDRSVLIKGRKTANLYIISCSNFYTGEVHFSGGLPRTTKADGECHGIGLTSVHRVVEKYGGVLSVKTTPDHRWILTITFPDSE